MCDNYIVAFCTTSKKYGCFVSCGSHDRCARAIVRSLLLSRSLIHSLSLSLAPAKAISLDISAVHWIRCMCIAFWLDRGFYSVTTHECKGTPISCMHSKHSYILVLFLAPYSLKAWPTFHWNNTLKNLAVVNTDIFFVYFKHSSLTTSLFDCVWLQSHIEYDEFYIGQLAPIIQAETIWR